MKRLTPYEKLSKKDKKQVDAQRRKSWGDIKPVTRQSDNPRVYNRKRQRWQDDGVGVLLPKQIFFCERLILPAMRGIMPNVDVFKINAIFHGEVA